MGEITKTSSRFNDAPLPYNPRPTTRRNKETKSIRMSLVLGPNFYAEWKDFCSTYGISMNAGTETAIAAYMDAIREQYPIPPVKIV